jgi:hypothetical protein
LKSSLNPLVSSQEKALSGTVRSAGPMAIGHPSLEGPSALSLNGESRSLVLPPALLLGDVFKFWPGSRDLIKTRSSGQNRGSPLICSLGIPSQISEDICWNFASWVTYGTPVELSLD